LSHFNGNELASASITPAFVLILVHGISLSQGERLSRTPGAPDAPRVTGTPVSGIGSQ
jgi:hypothetical protein